MDKKIFIKYLVNELGFSKIEALDEFNNFSSKATSKLKEEFEYYIKNKTFSKDLISVKGYTAKILLESKVVINPYAAYNIMRQLMDNPEQTLRGIQSHFRVK